MADAARVVVDSSGIVQYANSAFCTVVDVDLPSNVVDRPLADFVSESDQDVLRTHLGRFSNGNTKALGLRLELDTEDRREIIGVSSPVTWEGEKHVQTTFIDTLVSTDSEVQEMAMHEAPVGITIADISEEDDPLIYVNDAFVRLTGYPRREVLGQNCRFLQGELTRDEPVARMRAAIDSREPVSVELRNYRKDGSMFWNRVTLVPVTDESGETTHFLGYQEDVSDKKLTERERLLFERHAEASSQMMFVTDREGTIEYVNTAFERTTGYSADEIIGKNPRVLKSDEHDEPFYKELWETITAGNIWEGEVTNRTKFGELYHVHQRIVPIVDDRNRITHFTAIHRNVTDEHLTEQVLNVLDRVFRHNVRTSLTVIEGFTEVLERETEESKRRAALESIRQRTAHMKKISDQLTTIRQVLQAKKEPSSLTLEHIEGVVPQLQDIHDEAAITLSMDTSGDREIKSWAIFELALEVGVENAVAHCDQETPRIDITVRQHEDRKTVCVDIADNGPGIPKSEWEIVKSGVETPLEHTTGIGLWILYWAITSLGGTVEHNLNEPHGTVLTLEIPLVPESG